MGETKQVQLNGAYHGPAIPSEKSYHRPGRGRGCAGGCFCCLLSFLWKIVLTIVIVVGLFALIVWLVLRPNEFRFHVTNATLTEFNLTTASTNTNLNYNLAINMTIRNPNKRIGVYYDRIEARAYYEDQRFSTVTFEPFYQGHKNTSSLNPTFKGQSLLVLDASELSDFASENISGVYNIDIKLYLRVRFKIGKLKTTRVRTRVSCDLEVPLKSSSGSTVGGTVFKTTKCEPRFQF